MTDHATAAREIRRRIIELGLTAGKNGAHLGSGLSIVEILAVLYGEILNLEKIRQQDAARDRFLLSKGHAAVALYAALEWHGFLTREETSTFEANGTAFYAHAHRDLSKGIEFSGGSLSLGLSYGVGVALAGKRAGRENRVIVLVGDGECDEGLVWEAAMAAANFGLGNLNVIVDCNGMQSDGSKLEIMNQFSIVEKFGAFGFEVCEVDGHCTAALSSAFKRSDSNRPLAVIARTLKGKGISFMEGNPDWHHGVLSETLYQQALTELQGS
jgi:transketolase